MKKLEEMSEAEVLERAAQGIPGYLSGIRSAHQDFDVMKCVEAQAFELKMLYKESRGLGRWGTMTNRDLLELDALIGHFTPGMQEQALEAEKDYRKKHVAWLISASTAQALLVPAFEQAGLAATVELQRYRAKVSVRLGGRSVRFYATYKTLSQKGAPERLVQGVLDLKDALDRIGGDVKIYK